MRLCAGLLALGLGPLGCKREAAPTKPTTREPIDPAAPMQLANPDRARVQLELANLRAALSKHKALEGGEYPSSLSALGIKLSFPDDIVYDSSSGTVKSRAYPMF